MKRIVLRHYLITVLADTTNPQSKIRLEAKGIITLIYGAKMY